MLLQTVSDCVVETSLGGIAPTDLDCHQAQDKSQDSCHVLFCSQLGTLSLRPFPLLCAGECEFTLTTALEELQKDNYRVVSSQRPARCTGVALQVSGAAQPGSSRGSRLLPVDRFECHTDHRTSLHSDLESRSRSGNTHLDLLRRHGRVGTMQSQPNTCPRLSARVLVKFQGSNLGTWV